MGVPGDGGETNDVGEPAEEGPRRKVRLEPMDWGEETALLLMICRRRALEAVDGGDPVASCLRDVFCACCARCSEVATGGNSIPFTICKRREIDQHVRYKDYAFAASDKFVYLAVAVAIRNPAITPARISRVGLLSPCGESGRCVCVLFFF